MLDRHDVVGKGFEQFTGILSGAIARISALQLYAASFAWLSVLAWARPLSSPDEARYTDIPRWMVESGDWLLPRINGLPFVHKPPLYFWMEAGLMKVFGLSAFVARLPSLSAAILICICVYELVREFADERAAFWSVAVMVFNPLFYGSAQYADMNMLAASLITASLTCAVLATRCAPHQARRERVLWLCAYLAAGLGVLAKGLIGALLPGLIFVLYAGLRGQWPLLWRAVSIPGLLLFFATVAPWFAAMEYQLPGFAHYFFIFQHFTRYTTAEFNNPHGIWFYPVILFTGMVPWTIVSFPLWRQLLRTSPTRLSSLQILALIWLGVVVVFFSIPSSKIIGYMLPVVPAFAILVGPWIAERHDWLRAVAVGASLCVVGVVAAVLFQPQGTAVAAAQIRHQVRQGDKVVFYGDYYFDAALVLNRHAPTYVVADWTRPSKEMRDSVARQLTEGREFDQKSGQVLIGDAEFLALVNEADSLWVVVRHKPGTKPPAILDGLAVVVSQNGVTVLRKPPRT